jgi:heptosyltransferase-1
MKIAIVKLSALGDIVHAMLVLQFIKRFNPKIEIDWIVEKNFKGILEYNPDINHIHVINLNNAKKKKSINLLFRELKKLRKLKQYDLVIDMQGLIKSAIISKLIASKSTIGYDKNSLREGLSSLFYNKKFKIDYGLNVISRNAKLISNAINFDIKNEDIKNKKPFLFSKKKHVEFNLDSNKKNILLIAGASNALKCYSVKNYSELTTLIDANFLICWGTQREKIMAEEIKLISPDVNICEEMSVECLISLIGQVDLVIGSDTGPTHMAWALNIPSITLFGSTPGYRNSFVTDINNIIESDSIVDPYKIDKEDYSLNDIKPTEICEIAIKLL